MKSKLTVWCEGVLYAIIAAGSPIAEYLTSDRVITTRSMCAVGVIALVAGANAVKAFLSQSVSNQKSDQP